MRRSEMQTNRSHESIGVGNDREGTAVLRLPRRAVSPDPSLCHAIEVWMRDRQRRFGDLPRTDQALHGWGDRKSTRLNSSHVAISYAVFCLKKKKPALGVGTGTLTNIDEVSAPDRNTCL